MRRDGGNEDADVVAGTRFDITRGHLAGHALDVAMIRMDWVRGDADEGRVRTYAADGISRQTGARARTPTSTLTTRLNVEMKRIIEESRVVSRVGVRGRQGGVRWNCAYLRPDMAPGSRSSCPTRWGIRAVART